MNVEPVTLEGDHVRLEPLSVRDHLAGLQLANTDPAQFRWFPRSIETSEEMRTHVEERIAQRDAGTAIPFATVWRESDEVIGATNFLNVSRSNRRVEIGGTWLSPAYQRTAANTEAKYLQFSHAFEEWGCHRVELKTDSRNRRSRAAIERLGASEEGTLRQHMVTDQGFRDTVYFSVLDTEWPGVKQRLERKLDR